MQPQLGQTIGWSRWHSMASVMPILWPHLGNPAPAAPCRALTTRYLRVRDRNAHDRSHSRSRHRDHRHTRRRRHRLPRRPSSSSSSSSASSSSSPSSSSSKSPYISDSNSLMSSSSTSRIRSDPHAPCAARSVRRTPIAARPAAPVSAALRRIRLQVHALEQAPGICQLVAQLTHIGLRCAIIRAPCTRRYGYLCAARRRC